MIQRHGWNLLFHDCLIEQFQKLETAASRATTQDPEGFASNANVKLFDALATLILEVVPSKGLVVGSERQSSSRYPLRQQGAAAGQEHERG